jgi:hypothetical protein
MKKDVGEVARLLVDHVREVGGEARLRVSDDEGVRETVHMHAMQG